MSFRFDFKVEFDDYFVPLNAKVIRKTFRGTVMEEGKGVQRLYKYVQSRFSTKNRSKIRRKTGTDAGDIYSAVGTDQERGSVLIWLEDGTKVRYRKMSYGWRSKTRGGLSFGPGRGYATGFDMSGTLPPIAARNFRDAMVVERWPYFEARANKDFYAMVKKAGWT